MYGISQAKAAEIAGLSRSEFLSTLTRFGVSPLQYGADAVVTEAKREQALDVECLIEGIIL